jgi:hypothetical protein
MPIVVRTAKFIWRLMGRAIPEPLQRGRERWRWLAEADADTRAANPRHYWFHSDEREPRFFWHEIEVSAHEFRAFAPQDYVEILDAK